jgi:hypothetical protein
MSLSRIFRILEDGPGFADAGFGYTAVVRPALITAAACVVAAAAAEPAAAASHTPQPDLTGGGAATSATSGIGNGAPVHATSTLRTVRAIVYDIRWTRKHAIRRARRAALPIPRHGHAERNAVTRADLVQILDKWEHRLAHYRAAYARRKPVIDDLMCIHSYEGAWDAVSDTVPTYYGGLQMDATFEQAYGADVLAYRDGAHANRWPKHDQLMVGYRGYEVRGFTPWPTAAAACGLF